MRLCAVVKNGKIVLIAPVEDTHEFGDREKGYSHMPVKFVKSIPDKYNDPIRDRRTEKEIWVETV